MPAKEARPQTILVTEYLPQAEAEIRDRCAAAGHEVRFGRPFTAAADEYSEDELVAMVADVHALMVGSRERFTRRVLSAGKNLHTLAKLGIGVERIDVAAASDLGILVSNTPIPENYLTVAEYAVAALLTLAKRFKLADQHAREGKWRSVMTTLVRGKTVGIVGFGRIGSTVAELLAPFGVTRLAHDPAVGAERITSKGVEPVGLDELLARSDFVTLHAVVTDRNRNLLGERELGLMKPTAYLINTARGALIDEAALNRALRAGRIAGAALDVFEPEPPRPDNPLLDQALYDKTLFSPHTAGFVREGLELMPRVQLDNCLAALSGERPTYVVNEGALARWQERYRTSVVAATS